MEAENAYDSARDEANMEDAWNVERAKRLLVLIVEPFAVEKAMEPPVAMDDAFKEDAKESVEPTMEPPASV